MKIKKLGNICPVYFPLDQVMKLTIKLELTWENISSVIIHHYGDKCIINLNIFIKIFMFLNTVLFWGVYKLKTAGLFCLHS